MRYNWPLIRSAQELSRLSQEETFPYLMDPDETFGLQIQVNRHVFSPKHCKGWQYFTPRLPPLKGKRFMEIGSGHGIISCYAAREAAYVLATDINVHAAHNTQVNAKLNQLNNIDTVVGDVFSAINPGTEFDVIFWNSPWARIPGTLGENLQPEEYGMFDSELSAHKRFILEGKHYLSEKGVLILGFGELGEDIELINQFVAESGLRKEVEIGKFKPGEVIDGKLAEFTMHTLYLRK
jgi:release factor glutamine methyltransferase